MIAHKYFTIIILYKTNEYNKNNRPVVVGIFILLGIAILVAAIFTLGGQKKSFVKSVTVNAVFADVNGLIKGANVWFSGVKVGTVKEIFFYGDTKVQVTMNIEQDAQKFIHKNAKARIGSDGLIGNRIVVIYGGDESTLPVEKDDFLRVDKGFNTEEMMESLQKNSENLIAITNDFKSVSKKIDSGKGTIGTLINDTVLALKLSSTIDNLQATITNFKTVSLSGKAVMADLENFSGELTKPGNSMNELVSDTAIYGNILQTLGELQNAVQSVSGFASNLKTTSEKLNQKDNIAGVLLNDPESAAKVKNTLKSLETGSKKLDENLEALQHNFLLRGFFRKKAKAAEKAAKDSLTN